MMAEKNAPRSRRLAEDTVPIFLAAVEFALASDVDEDRATAAEWAQIVLALHQAGNRLD